MRLNPEVMDALPTRPELYEQVWHTIWESLVPALYEQAPWVLWVLGLLIILNLGKIIRNVLRRLAAGALRDLIA